jgi:hypothetical protein
MAGASQAQRDRAGGGPTPGGFGGMLEGDPVADASAHLTDDQARLAWEEGLALTVDQAATLARSGAGPGSEINA